MTNYVGPGNTLTFTAAAAIVSGALVAVGTLVGVAAGSYASGDTQAVASIDGIYEVPKLSAGVITVGAALYLDASEGHLTLVATDNTYAGKAYAAAAGGVTTVQVILNKGA